MTIGRDIFGGIVMQLKCCIYPMPYRIAIFSESYSSCLYKWLLNVMCGGSLMLITCYDFSSNLSTVKHCNSMI